jgi:hypothetical protein
MKTTERVAEALRDWSEGVSPAPSESQLDRILERRRQGERLALPMRHQRPSPWPWIGVSAAAALAGLLLTPSENQTATRTLGADPFDASFLPATLAAQARTDDVGPDEYTIRDLDAERLTPSQAVYLHRPVGGPSGRPVWEDSITVSRGGFQGEPAWLLTSTRGYLENGGTLRPPIDSIWLRRTDLMPLARASILTTGYRFAETFAGDSAVSRFEADGLVRTFRTRNFNPGSGTALTGPLSISLLLPLLPLNELWQGNFRYVGVSNSGELIDFRTYLRVRGSKAVTVPAGTFDCWVVTFREEDGYFWLVSKNERWVVEEGLRLNGRETPLRVLVSHEAKN